MYALGIIPARGGSKGLPRKNVLPLGGVPLIGWTIRCAADSELLSHALVSTDDDEIAAVAEELGGDVPFRRPTDLADDESPVLAVLQHAVRWIEEERRLVPDLVVLLQPTSPLRRPADIDDTIRLVRETGCTSAQTVAADDTHPWHRYTLDEQRRMESIFPGADVHDRRQAAPVVYRPTGSVYVTRHRTLMDDGDLYGPDRRGLVVPSEYSVDIDDALDFKIAEALLGDRAGH